MPLPFIPIIIGAGSLLAAGYGAKKGLDANKKIKKAKRLGVYAREKHEKALQALDEERQKANSALEELGQLKARIFSEDIGDALSLVKKRKDSAHSTLAEYQEEIKAILTPEVRKMVEKELDLAGSILSGGVTGAMAAWGAYGSAALLGTASTGAAISSLSGVAATNATLAWLGGGALAAGGFGMAAAPFVLGGVLVGPGLAVTGLVMAAKAEEALTEAWAYVADVEKKIADLSLLEEQMRQYQKVAHETRDNLEKLTLRYKQIRVDDWRDEKAAGRQIAFAMGLKKILEMPLLDEESRVVPGVSAKIQAQTAGLLEIAK